jgi:hypothetical protein
MNPELAIFEQHIVQRPAVACRVLGMAYSNYASYHSRPRPLPTYIVCHIDTLMRLDAASLQRLVRERVA